MQVSWQQSIFDEDQSPESKMYVCDIDPATSVVASRLWYYAINKMASNIQLTTGRDREIAGLICMFR